MSSVKCSKTIRNNVKKLLNETINNEKISNNLEIGIYNFTIKISTQKNIVKKWENQYFIHIYKDRLRSILMNLKSEDLLNKLKSGDFKPHELSFMSHQEMQPDKWKEKIELKNERENNRYVAKIEANTDNFTCRKCKSNQCSYYQLQTRSADEPMTTYVTCISCGNRWKC